MYTNIMPMCRYVEEKYTIEIGNAQTTQLAKALNTGKFIHAYIQRFIYSVLITWATGVEKGIFLQPKGRSFIAPSKILELTSYLRSIRARKALSARQGGNI